MFPVTCTAPARPLVGGCRLPTFLPEPGARHRFRKAVDQAGYSQLNTMGLVACRAAYEEGGEWLEQLKGYLQENLVFARDYIANNLPGIHLIEPEGTYLIWLDLRELGLTEAEREDLIVNKAKHLAWTVVPSSARMVKASSESISPARGQHCRKHLTGWRKR